MRTIALAPIALGLLFASAGEAGRPTDYGFTQGSITFSQGGKDSTWKLQEGAAMNGGGRFVFTPDGEAPVPKSPVIVMIRGCD